MAEQRSRQQTLMLTATALLVTALFLFVAVEFASYYVLVVKGANFYLPLDLSDRAKIPEPGPAPTEYYYDLGWEPVYPNEHGYRGPAMDTDEAAVAVFGDSYTKAHPDLEKSWPYLLAQDLGRPVLNFGVSGYGTDQAYLRFEKRYVGRLDVPYVVLLVMSENIARTVNVYRGFYQRMRKVRPTKPRFVLNAEGEIELLPNPIGASGEVAKLWDEEFLERIGEHDYWYRYYGRHGLNEPVGFPYSYYLGKALPYYLMRGYQNRFRNRRIYDDLYENPESAEIMRQILNRFVTRAEESGSMPIIFFLPNWKDMVDHETTGTTIYKSFYDAYRRDDYALSYDAMDYYSLSMDQGRSVSDFFLSRTDGHYNAAGERVLADALHATLMQLEARSGKLSRLPRTP